MYKKFWNYNDKAILSGLGSVSAADMETKVSALYEQFDTNRKTLEAKSEDLKELEEIEKLLKTKKKK